ncbi:MAG TPA: hypothetical protein VFR74_08410 [Jiangellales bacterium]|nr:hypothetical protein [Jiangellales bacterium]
MAELVGAPVQGRAVTVDTPGQMLSLRVPPDFGPPGPAGWAADLAGALSRERFLILEQCVGLLDRDEPTAAALTVHLAPLPVAVGTDALEAALGLAETLSAPAGHPRAVAVTRLPAGPAAVLEEVVALVPPGSGTAHPVPVGISQAHLPWVDGSAVLVTTLATPMPRHLPVYTAVLADILESMTVSPSADDEGDR